MPSTVTGIFLGRTNSGMLNETSNDKNLFQPIDLYRVTIHSPEELPYRTGQNHIYGKYEVSDIFVSADLQKIDKEL